MISVAAIDVGSNATRLATLTTDAAGRALSNQFYRFNVRLGASVFDGGAVDEAATEKLVGAFLKIRSTLKEAGITQYRGVATAAMREAVNASDVLQTIKRATGVRLKVIDGVEEARLARAALLRAVGPLTPNSLLIDLGGGSLELTRAGGDTSRGVSLPLGSVRLLSQFPALKGPTSPAQCAAAAAHVHEKLNTFVDGSPPASLAIGTGGNLEILAHLIGVSAARLPAVDLALLPSLVNDLCGLSVAERIQRYKVRADRADLILPAAVIVAALAERLQIAKLIVPGTGLRDALLCEQLRPKSEAALARDLAAPLAEVDRRRAAVRARAVVQLFDALTPLHGLWPNGLVPAVLACYAWYRRWALGHTDVDDALASVRTDAAGRSVAHQIMLALCGGEASGSAGLYAGMIDQVECFAQAHGDLDFSLSVDLDVQPLRILANPHGAAASPLLTAALQRSFVVVAGGGP